MSSCLIIKLNFEEKESLESGKTVIPCDLLIPNVEPKFDSYHKPPWLAPQQDSENAKLAYNAMSVISDVFQFYVGHGEIIRLKEMLRNPHYLAETSQDNELISSTKTLRSKTLELSYRIEGIDPLLGAIPPFISANPIKSFWNDQDKRDLLALYTDALRLKDLRSQFRELHRVLERADTILSSKIACRKGEWNPLRKFLDNEGHSDWSMKLAEWKKLRDRCSHARQKQYIKHGDLEGLEVIRSTIQKIQPAARFLVERTVAKGSCNP